MGAYVENRETIVLHPSQVSSELINIKMNDALRSTTWVSTSLSRS